MCPQKTHIWLENSVIAKEKAMTNRKLWIGMLVLALVFGMTVVGCDNGSTDVGGKEEAIALPATSGEFTFTGIPSKYNGKFAFLFGEFSANSSRGLVGWKSATINTSDPKYLSTWTCVKIENGTVKIPLYTFSFSSSSPASTIQPYTGNDSAYVGIAIVNSEIISAATNLDESILAVFGTEDRNGNPTSFPVQFSSGKASKANSEATVKLNN
jgi:hypothetical protein